VYQNSRKTVEKAVFFCATGEVSVPLTGVNDPRDDGRSSHFAK